MSTQFPPPKPKLKNQIVKGSPYPFPLGKISMAKVHELFGDPNESGGGGWFVNLSWRYARKINDREETLWIELESPDKRYVDPGQKKGWALYSVVYRPVDPIPLTDFLDPEVFDPPPLIEYTAVHNRILLTWPRPPHGTPQNCKFGVICEVPEIPGVIDRWFDPEQGVHRTRTRWTLGDAWQKAKVIEYKEIESKNQGIGLSVTAGSGGVLRYDPLKPDKVPYADYDPASIR
jgi:hypothetical protein